MQCRKCGAAIPASAGRGRPRSMCAECSPPRKPSRPRLELLERVVAAVPVDRDPPVSVVEAVERELSASGRRWSAAGMTCVLLAQRMEDAEGEPGAVMAQLARQLHASMAEALADSEVGGMDDLDRLLADG